MVGPAPVSGTAAARHSVSTPCPCCRRAYGGGVPLASPLYAIANELSRNLFSILNENFFLRINEKQGIICKAKKNPRRSGGKRGFMADFFLGLGLVLSFLFGLCIPFAGFILGAIKYRKNELSQSYPKKGCPKETQCSVFPHRNIHVKNRKYVRNNKPKKTSVA